MMELHGCNVYVKPDVDFHTNWLVVIGEGEDQIGSRKEAFDIREEIISLQKENKRLKEIVEKIRELDRTEDDRFRFEKKFKEILATNGAGS